MLALPDQDVIVVQVLNIAGVSLGTFIFPDHPLEMGIPEAAVGRIGITVVIIDIQMVTAMIRCPGNAVILQCAGPAQGKNKSHDGVSLVGLVGPEAVIARRDRHFTEYHQDEEADPFKGIVAVGKSIPGNDCEYYQWWDTQYCQVQFTNRGFGFGLH